MARNCGLFANSTLNSTVELQIHPEIDADRVELIGKNSKNNKQLRPQRNRAHELEDFDRKTNSDRWTGKWWAVAAQMKGARSSKHEVRVCTKRRTFCIFTVVENLCLC